MRSWEAELVERQVRFPLLKEAAKSQPPCATIELMPPDGVEITRLLNDFRSGGAPASGDLIALLYPELRKLAARALRRQRIGHTWQSTELIHEAYIRLVERTQPEWQSRAHFYAVASTIMRNIMVDHARKRLSAKRGSGGDKVTFNEAVTWSNERPGALVALDDALSVLARLDERRAKILEMRFFGGMSVEETAEATGVSTATVGREMRLAEAWLARELSQKNS